MSDTTTQQEAFAAIMGDDPTGVGYTVELNASETARRFVVDTADDVVEGGEYCVPFTFVCYGNCEEEAESFVQSMRQAISRMRREVRKQFPHADARVFNVSVASVVIGEPDAGLMTVTIERRDSPRYANVFEVFVKANASSLVWTPDAAEIKKKEAE